MPNIDEVFTIISRYCSVNLPIKVQVKKKQCMHLDDVVYGEYNETEKDAYEYNLPPSGTYPIQMETRLPYLERVCRT